MKSYKQAYSEFSVDAFATEILQGNPSDGLNACVECCDRWAANEKIALHWMGEDGSRASKTFSALRQDAARFANL